MQKSIKLSSVQTDLPIELQYLWVGEIVFYAWAVFHLDKGQFQGHPIGCQTVPGICRPFLPSGTKAPANTRTLWRQTMSCQ